MQMIIHPLSGEREEFHKLDMMHFIPSMWKLVPRKSKQRYYYLKKKLGVK